MPSKLKIALLYDIWNEDPVAAAAKEKDKDEEAPRPKPRRKKNTKTKRVEKTDREEIFEALKKLGHEPSYFELDGRPASLHSLSRSDADLIFNLIESFDGDDTKEMHVVAYMDLMGLHYTGAGPHSIFLSQDKSIAKKIFAFHGIRTPFFATSYKGRIDHSHDIAFPLIVKPSSEDGSIGIDAGSVVDSVKDLMERIHYIHEEFDSPALIEEYIEGREIYAAIIGNENAEVLPLVELDLSKLPKGTPRIAGKEVKWEKETEAYKVTKSAVAEDLDEETAKVLSETALSAYRALKLRDYGRIDMRLSKKKDEVYVIEANPNPWLYSGAEFSMAAKKAGRNYTTLIEEIVDLALARSNE